MKKIHFMIHDLNPWGGQDRSTLEVVNQISQEWAIKLHSYSVEGLKRKSTTVSRIRPWIRRPVFLKAVYYHFYTAGSAWRARSRGEEVLSTGTCSLVATRFQIQFIHHAWHEVENLHPDIRSRSPMYKRFYEWVWRHYNLLNEKWVYRNTRHYLALSNRVKSDLVRFFGISPHRIQVIPHGVEARIFSPVSALEKVELKKKMKTGDAKVILFVGEYRRKGLEVAIRAFAGISPGLRQGWVLLAVGMGDRKYFQGVAASLGVESVVLLHEHTRDISAYFRLADLFLLPTHYEPFGLVTIEALASGLPSIVSRSSGAYELACEGESIIGIEDPGSVEEVARLLAEMLGDEDRRLKIGAAGKRVAEKRDWACVAREYEAWLNLSGAPENG